EVVWGDACRRARFGNMVSPRLEPWVTPRFVSPAWTSLTAMRLAAVAAAALGALVIASSASAASGPQSPLGKRLNQQQATRVFLAQKKVRDWVGRYPQRGLITQASYDRAWRDW